MVTLTLLPSGTSVVFTSNVISTDLSPTINFGNETMAALTVLQEFSIIIIIILYSKWYTVMYL